MKKLANLNYKDGIFILEYPTKKYGEHSIKLVETTEVTHIYLFGDYFDTFDNYGKSGGYMLSAE